MRLGRPETEHETRRVESAGADPGDAGPWQQEGAQLGRAFARLREREGEGGGGERERQWERESEKEREREKQRDRETKSV